MLIGLWALYELGRQFYWSRAHPSCAPGGHHGFCYGIPQSYDVLNLTGDALAAAAAVELVYTLFTKGPDEALDPLMLGLSAAALLSLGSVSGFKVSDGVTLIRRLHGRPCLGADSRIIITCKLLRQIFHYPLLIPDL